MEPNQTITQPKNKKRLIATITAIAVVIIAGLGYLYIRNKNATPPIDPRLVELQKLKDSSTPDNTTTQQKLDNLQKLEKSSNTTQTKNITAEARLQELSNLSKQ